MTKRGFTITELISALVIGGVILLSVTALFVGQYRFREAVSNDAVAARETRLAMNHMTRLIRFAKIDTTLIPDIRADLDGNGQVESADVGIFLGSLNKKEGDPGYDSRADLSGDKKVDINDFKIFMSYYPAAGIVAGNDYLGGLIEKDHVYNMTQDTVASYIRNQNNEIEFALGTNPAVVIARYITTFSSSYTDPYVQITLTSTKDGATSPLETKIRRITQ